MALGSFTRRTSALVVALVGLASTPPARAADDRQETLTFQRGEYSQRACLEYSWVPEGKRHVIVLEPKERMRKATDTVAGDANPTLVQVYVVTNGGVGAASLSTVFPAQPDRSKKVVGALVDVVNDRYALGTIHYDDNTSSKPVQIKLSKKAPKCPTIHVGE